MITVLALLSLFSWFDNPVGNTGDHLEQLRQHATHANTTMTVNWWDEAAWSEAERLGLKVIVSMPDDFFWAVPDSNPQPLPLTFRMWDRTGIWAGTTAQDWVDVMNRHRSQIAGIRVTDETDCNTDDGLYRFPNWPRVACEKAARKVATLHRMIKGWLPWLKTWSNYTASYAYFWLLTDTSRVQSVYGASLPADADWLSFDCYTPFASCYGSNSVERLLGTWLKSFRSHQTALLLPRAFLGNYLRWNPTVEQLTTMCNDYRAYTKREPRISGIVSFIWRDVEGVGTGAGQHAAVAAPFVQFALDLKPPAAPTGLRVVYD